MKNLFKLSAIFVTLGIVGCSTVNNPCNPQGDGHCASVTTAYNNSLKDTVQPTDLPKGEDCVNCTGSQLSQDGSKSSSSSSDDNLSNAYSLQNSYSQIPTAGNALRTPTRTMRTWILPYEDNLGIYHDQQFIYLVIDKGTWRYKSINLRDSSNVQSTALLSNAIAASASNGNNGGGSGYKPFPQPKKSASDPISMSQNAFGNLNNVSNKNASIMSGVMPPTAGQ